MDYCRCSPVIYIVRDKLLLPSRIEVPFRLPVLPSRQPKQVSPTPRCDYEAFAFPRTAALLGAVKTGYLDPGLRSSVGGFLFGIHTGEVVILGASSPAPISIIYKIPNDCTWKMKRIRV